MSSQMTTAVLARPAPSEHDPYFAKYVAFVPEGDFLAVLARQGEETAALLRGLTADQAEHRYAPGKWSVKEVVAHFVDAERVFAYRALRFARGDETPLPGYDHDLWTAHADTASRTLESLIEEFITVRHATLSFARSLTVVSEQRQGPANNASVSVRALLYLIAGHELHHVAILRERYGI
jgi:uncharacterized damage-inducible protein DinB